MIIGFLESKIRDGSAVGCAASCVLQLSLLAPMTTVNLWPSLTSFARCVEDDVQALMADKAVANPQSAAKALLPLSSAAQRIQYI